MTVAGMNAPDATGPADISCLRQLHPALTTTAERSRSALAASCSLVRRPIHSATARPLMAGVRRSLLPPVQARTLCSDLGT